MNSSAFMRKVSMQGVKRDDGEKEASPEYRSAGEREWRS